MKCSCEAPCLFVAACLGSLEICTLLLQHPSPPPIDEREKFLHITSLGGACENGHENVASFLLKKGACPTYRDAKGRSILVKACGKNRIACVRLLLENGVGPNEPPLLSVIQASEQNGMAIPSPLVVPCAEGNVELVKLLLDHGTKADGVHELDFPLFTASHCGHWEICRLLLDHGADINRMGTGKYTRYLTPLSIAIKSQHIEVIRGLLDRGASVHIFPDDPEHEELNVLTQAINTGNKTIVELVLKHGATVARWERCRYHPLLVCAMKGNVPIAKLLWDHGFRWEQVSKDNPPLVGACWSNHTEMIDFLLECGIDPNQADSDGKDALFMAALNGNVSVVQRLLDRGAPVDGQDGSGKPISIATAHGHVDVMRLLISKGAKLNVCNPPLLHAISKGDVEWALELLAQGTDPNYLLPGDRTFLWYAASYGHLDITKALVERGAMKNGPPVLKSSPLVVASENGHLNVVQFLLQVGADPDDATRTITPLTVACKKGHVSIVQVLVQAGADINRTSEGFSALWMATREDRMDCVQYLIEKGASPVILSGPASTTILDQLMMKSGPPNLEMVRFLIRAQVPLKTPAPMVCVAAQHGSLELLQLVLEEGADATASDKDMDGALHYAVYGGREKDVLACLLKHGCNLETKNRRGFTPLYLAVIHEDVEMVGHLFALGADPLSLNRRLGEYSPADICANHPQLRSLLAHALSPEGVAQRQRVLPERNRCD
mmetsp:Transcript_25599/g.64250  ORF Transcript_25599/g.64250 Transcript_25599/m.64250 type:complete len:724 (+) Transcript_25599:66-2237(+)